MAAQTDEHSIDIDLELVSSMVKKVFSLKDSGSWKDGLRTIHRVPLNIRKRDEDAYEPKILSIGPFHRANKNLQAMEVHKWRYLRELLGHDDLEVNITICVEKIKDMEKKARSCYSEIIDRSSEEFVEMMLLDGCFIVQFLIQRYFDDEESKREKSQAGDPIYAVSWMSPLLRHDLLSLENQIPFAILDAIFDVAQRSRQVIKNPSLIELALNYVTHGKTMETPKASDFQPHHLLHLHHWIHSCVPSKSSPRSQYCPLVASLSKVLIMPHRRVPSSAINSFQFTEERTPRTIPCASELREAGVRFRKKESDICFLDVTFSGRVLEMPFLSIGNSANPLFRNLIAFEQCCPAAAGSKFTSYALLMDDLINTSRDVAILESWGILENKLGSDEEVALLFNRLLLDVTFTAESNIYADLFKRVNAHCGSRWNKWRAKLAREYFSNPWSIISLLAAIVLLVLTIIQTVYSMLSYYHGPTLTPDRS